MRWLRVALAAPLLIGCSEAAPPAIEAPPNLADRCPPDAARLCVPAEPCVLSICGPDEVCVTYRPPARSTACIPCAQIDACDDPDVGPPDAIHDPGPRF